MFLSSLSHFLCFPFFPFFFPSLLPSSPPFPPLIFFLTSEHVYIHEDPEDGDHNGKDENLKDWPLGGEPGV